MNECLLCRHFFLGLNGSSDGVLSQRFVQLAVDTLGDFGQFLFGKLQEVGSGPVRFSS